MDRLKYAVAWAGWLAISSAAFSGEGWLVSKQGSERATSGSGGKIVTFGGKTHVVWQDSSEKGYLNQVRTFDRETKRWSETVTLNKGRDNHARPVITVDDKGFLHVILSGHNSPVTYRRSANPNDSSLWTEAETIGDGTYPTPACGPNGTLLVTMRSTPGWNGVDLYTKKPGRPWSEPVKLVIRDPELPGYAGFQTGMAWGPGHRTLHLVVDFYESRETYVLRGVHQAVCYLRSRDLGKTWEKADGTRVSLPARPEQMDTLAQSRGDRGQKLPPPFILAQGSIVVDQNDHPHVLFVSHLDESGQVIHARADSSGRWRQAPVEVIAKANRKHRPLGCRGSLTMTKQGEIRSLLELVSLETGWTKEGKPTRGLVFEPEGKRLVWLSSKDLGRSWSVSEALPADAIFHEPNVERRTGFNEIAGVPPFLYFDGLSRYPKGKERIRNRVFYVGD